MKKMTEEQKRILGEIEWELKNIWQEFQVSSDAKEKEKAQELLKEYQRMQREYKRQKMMFLGM